MWNISNRKERISKEWMYESCTAQLNEWKSDAKGEVEGEREEE
jgi:hypothetical protein